MENLAQLTFELIGGLGIFLLGMKNMSDGMQAVAGSGLRRLIGAVTNNRFLALVVGTFVTCVVQSSSVTTVMVVGFVNSGVMELAQAVGVIMGANIGTTITGWILVLKVGKYGLPVLGAAAFFYLFSRSDRRRYVAMAIMGVGMVFFGLELMKDACSIIKETPSFEAWFQKFTADNYFGVLKCALAGCILTTMVQSSSATLGITISLATQGIISYPTAAALVLGENIGTTITALLASLGATTNAKRAAYFHVIFNICGVLWITLIFSWYIGLIQRLIGIDVAEPLTRDGRTTYPNTTAAIAATHSVFNIANTLLFLPLVPYLVKSLVKLVPSKEFKEKPRLSDLDMRLMESPVIAIEQSRREVQRMGEGCRKMLDWLKQLRTDDAPERPLGDRIRRREQVLDSVQEEVAEYITNLLSGNIPHSAADEARRQLRMAHEFESISDYVVNLDEFDRKLRVDGLRFPDHLREQLDKLHDQLAEYLDAVNEAVAGDNRNAVTKTEPAKKRLQNQIKQLRLEHLAELSTRDIKPRVSVAYLATLNAYSRVVDHAHNVTEAIDADR